jgi:D-alanyl-lipoteichoic acid acyltransferase DltB (MBOAT superfamily)
MFFRPVYILILAFTILVDYFAGRWIEESTDKRRKIFLLASIAANVGVLAFFKYFNFLNDNVGALSNLFGIGYPIPNLDFILPIGLSFHTFQSISYTVEVYRGNQKAERHPGIFALYVMFYPQLVAGPIERPQNMLHQFRIEHRFDYFQATHGLKLMCWGFLKKTVVADRLAPFVNQVYNNPYDYPGISLAIATVFFAFQIYCDFSGYSDIAIGAAQVMGFRLMTNFDSPYLSSSISEFWRHWHISLSTWFRDYVYIPLGGNRVSRWRQYRNLLATFLISGLWHGANWTYVIWGGLNGLYLIIEQILERRFPIAHKLPVWLRHPYQLLRIALTFALICFAWIFFRARTSADAFYIVSHLCSGWGDIVRNLQNLAFLKMYVLMRLDPTDFIIAVSGIAALLVIELLKGGIGLRDRMALQPAWMRWSIYYAAVIVLLVFGSFSNSQDFIYFQF